MGQIVRGSATIMQAVQAAMQRLQVSPAQLSETYNINAKTVAKWRKSDSVDDLKIKIGPKEPRFTVLTQAEEAVIVAFRRRPRLLSDNCASYVSGELAEWLGERQMSHVRGAPYHPQTQGKIERWHQALKNRIR